MSYEHILFEIDGGVATVTLNRPAQLNAWTATMSRELGEARRVCDADDAVRAVIVTGAGRAFCAGADLSRGDKTFAGRSRATVPVPSVAPMWPYQVRKPVIAAINGHAVGVGITYPMLADIRLIAEPAKVSFAMVRRGVLPELASHLTVAQVSGFANAADLLLTGRTITASEAVAMGLANALLPLPELLPRARAIAADIAANTAPVSVALTKQLLWESLAGRIPSLMAKEGRLLGWLGDQADVREGVLSFLEKRAPKVSMRVSKEFSAAPAD